MSSAALIGSIGEEAASATEDPSPYGSDFEIKVISHVLRDTTFMQQCDDLVSKDYFSDAAARFLVSLAKNHYRKYESAPSLRSMTTYIQGALKTGRLKKASIPAIKELMKEVYEEPLSDYNYVVERVTTFARHRALQAALEKVVEDMERSESTGIELDYGAIEQTMQNVMMIGANDAGSGYDYFANIAARTEAREEAASGTSSVGANAITTGYAALDSLLYHKGWGRRELYVFMGAPKSGKSTALGQFSINACQAGHDVLYVTLEVSDLVMSDRMDANMSGVPMTELTDRSGEIQKEINKLAGKCGKFMIHQYPTGSFTCKDLSRLIEHYRSRGVTFDMIAVDYGDIMAPDYRTTDPIENSKSIYVGLRAIAQKYDAVMLTATQTNREGARSSVATMTDVAEDFNKIRIADLVISINKTEEERANQEARLYFAASRNQRSDICLRVKQDLERMQFLNKVLDVT